VPPQVPTAIVGGVEAARELGDEDRRDPELQRLELGGDAGASLVEQEAERDPHERKHPHREFPRNLVALDEQVVAVAAGKARLHGRRRLGLRRSRSDGGGRLGAGRLLHLGPPYRTVNLVASDLVAPPERQVTVIGHVPSVVLRPTVHAQPTAPLSSEVAGPSPPAFDGPDL
jgi:hypothetical protein